MKLLDKNGRLFGKISFIDIVVIIVVVLLAAGIYMRFFSLQTTAAVGQPSEPIGYTLKISAVRQYTVDAITVGDRIFDENGSENLGTITAIEVKDAYQWGPTADGTAKYGAVEGKYDIFLTVDGDGVIADGRYYVGRVVQLGASQTDDFTTKYCTFTGKVLEIGAK